MAGAPGIQFASNFPEVTDLDPVLTEIYYQHLGELDPMLERLFRVLDSNKAKETDLRIGSFGDPQEFRDRVIYDAAEPDYTIEYSHTEYASGFKIQRKLFDDKMYGGFFESAEDLGRAFRRKVEKDAASLFNNAFSTLGYDGKALCADDHPRSESDSTNVDNKLALALTADNLNTAWVQFQSLVDDRGELISANPDLLIVPPNLMRTAHELTRSALDPESAENAVNPYAGLQYMVWNRLTDTTAWFLVDSTMMRRYLKWYWRVRPEFKGEQDFDTYIRKYAGYMRYSFGWSDFRWVIGSTGGD